jgi:Acetyltransferases, including N-acetylases of ribosomal proteins
MREIKGYCDNMRVEPAGELTATVGKYICSKIGMELVEGTYQALMVLNSKNDFVAGVVVANFRSAGCEISCASETSAAWRPQVMRAVFSYIFDQLGCVRVTAITTKSNKRAREFLERLGFVLEGNLRRGYDGRRDALLYGLLRDECRFLADFEGSLNGQEYPPSANAARSDADGTGSGPDEQGDGGSAS